MIASKCGEFNHQEAYSLGDGICIIMAEEYFLRLRRAASTKITLAHISSATRRSRHGGMHIEWDQMNALPRSR
jgi:hypothetical protein